MESNVKNRDACDPCRKRKIKCSGHYPECTHCARLCLRCEYSAAKRIGRPRRSRLSGSNSSPGSRIRSPPVCRTDPAAAAAAAAINPSMHASVYRPPPAAETHAVASFAATTGMDTFPASSPTTRSAGFATRGGDDTWLMPPESPDMADTQAFDASQWCVPCLMQNVPPVGDDAALNNDFDLGTSFVPPGCQCCQDIAQYFTAIDGPNRTFEQVQSLRQATDLAHKVLDCPVCFNVSHGEASISKNILMLGALMSDIAMSYGQLLSRIIKDAASSQTGDHEATFDIVFGLQAQPDTVISAALSYKSYSWLLKGALGEDLARLSALCVDFENRQLKAHELGHEECEPGQLCRYGYQGAVSAVSKHTDICPRSVDPKKTFACFRTVNQVYAAIQETQRMLVS